MPEKDTYRRFEIHSRLSSLGLFCLFLAENVELKFLRTKKCHETFQVLMSPQITTAQGPIIQVWPSGQITLTGDVIGSRGGTM